MSEVGPQEFWYGKKKPHEKIMVCELFRNWLEFVGTMMPQ